MIDFVVENAVILIFSVITPIIMMYTHKLMTALAHRWNLQNAAEYEAQVAQLVETAIKGLEQKAITLAKDNLKTPEGKAKLDEAISWVNGELEARKLRPVTPTQLAMKVEAKLWDEVDK